MLDLAVSCRCSLVAGVLFAVMVAYATILRERRVRTNFSFALANKLHQIRG